MWNKTDVASFIIITKHDRFVISYENYEFYINQC